MGPNQARREAAKWWNGKPDPSAVPEGTYLCDACGAPIRNKEGTSLLGGWMRCEHCTWRAFRYWDLDQQKRGIIGRARFWWTYHADPSTWNCRCSNCGSQIDSKEGTSIPEGTPEDTIWCQACTAEIIARWDREEAVPVE